MKTLIETSALIFNVKGLFADKERGEDIELVADPHSENFGKPVNGCTYNMNRRTDALCFKTALARFLRTGTKEDAFEVFFCYAEIFSTFGGYGNGIDTLLNLLYDHESRAATLLAKHRDHYSHSVYVFALGLAFFMKNANIRNAFAKKYGRDALYQKFLKTWGMAALFHDVGYPYEISFLDVLQYGEKLQIGEKPLTSSYRNLQEFITLSPEEVKKCGTFMPKGKNDIHSLIAEYVLKHFGRITGVRQLDVKLIEDCLTERIVKAEKYLDHGYFSAVLFLRKLLQTSDDGFVLDTMTLDAVMAIFLHNSFYKNTYKTGIKGSGYRQMPLKEQPVAYLLMLCDELQCWDRIPYGELTKQQELAWDIDIKISDTQICVTYYFEQGNDRDLLKVKGLYGDINTKVVNLSELARNFVIQHAVKKRDKRVYDYLSCGKFVDLRKIAESINESYCGDFDACKDSDAVIGHMVQSFSDLTLEYKLSNIEQAKFYVRHLDSIGCFMSDKQLDYEEVKSFTKEERDYLARNEHIRWVGEKVEMGWKYGTSYMRLKGEEKKYVRERKRIHKDIVPFEDLDRGEQYKDYRPIDRMIAKLAVYGIRVYRLNADKREYALGCTGHIDLNRINGFSEDTAREQIREYLRGLSGKFSLRLYSGFADGADLLFAEEALKCGVKVIAVLPCAWKKFKSEHSDGGVKFMQLLGQTYDVVTVGDKTDKYSGVSNYIVQNSDEIIALWDGKKLALTDENGKEINRGGTYHTLTLAENAGRKRRLFHDI